MLIQSKNKKFERKKKKYNNFRRTRGIESMKPPFLRIYIGSSKNLEISLQNVNENHLSEILSVHLKNIICKKEDESQISVYILPSERESEKIFEELIEFKENDLKTDFIKEINKTNNPNERNSNKLSFEHKEEPNFYNYIEKYSDEDKKILKSLYEEKNDVLLAGWQVFIEEKDVEELNDTINRFLSKHGNRKNNLKKNKQKINNEKAEKQVLKQTNTYLEDEKKEILCSIEEKMPNKKKIKKLKSGIGIFEISVNS